MQRVASLLPSWDTTKTGSKKGFDKVWGWADKLGAPVNKMTNKIGSEAFWPMSLDKESDKAARILRSFCKDGFYTDDEFIANGDKPTGRQRVMVKIPQEVIKNAVGLAIFTTMRTGLWISGAGGSGILVAKKEDGTWSPPSGILVHTAGLGFMVGVDIYDCVVVINSRKSLEAFTKLRATLGGEVSAVAGPVGVGGILDHDGKWKQANKPVFTYMKSRGFYAGVQVDGTVIIERSDENEKFYLEKIGVTDILAGKVRHPPHEIRMLMETLKAAEGRSDVNEELMTELDGQPAPGDVEIDVPAAVSPGIPRFGIPEVDDPDPFGVLALENAGLEIREAGSRSRPESSQFEYRPSPTSPVFAQFNRQSLDTFSNRGNRSNRNSHVSSKPRTSLDKTVQTVEMGTQTDNSPELSPAFIGEHMKAVEEENTDTVVSSTQIRKPVNLPAFVSPVSPSDAAFPQANLNHIVSPVSPVSPTQPTSFGASDSQLSFQEPIPEQEAAVTPEATNPTADSSTETPHFAAPIDYTSLINGTPYDANHPHHHDHHPNASEEFHGSGTTATTDSPSFRGDIDSSKAFPSEASSYDRPVSSDTSYASENEESHPNHDTHTSSNNDLDHDHDADDDLSDLSDVDVDDDDEPVVYEAAAMAATPVAAASVVKPTQLLLSPTSAAAAAAAAAATTTPVGVPLQARGSIVEIPKRGPPPALPMRSPARASTASTTSTIGEGGNTRESAAAPVGAAPPPLRSSLRVSADGGGSGFEEAELHSLRSEGGKHEGEEEGKKEEDGAERHAIDREKDDNNNDDDNNAIDIDAEQHRGGGKKINENRLSPPVAPDRASASLSKGDVPENLDGDAAAAVTDKITAATAAAAPAPTEDSETFHSLPTTPMERV